MDKVMYKRVEREEFKGYSGQSRAIVTDCPNPGDFEKVVKNAERCIKIQDDFWKRKAKQEKDNPQGIKWGLN